MSRIQIGDLPLMKDLSDHEIKGIYGGGFLNILTRFPKILPKPAPKPTPKPAPKPQPKIVAGPVRPVMAGTIALEL